MSGCVLTLTLCAAKCQLKSSVVHQAQVSSHCRDSANATRRCMLGKKILTMFNTERCLDFFSSVCLSDRLHYNSQAPLMVNTMLSIYPPWVNLANRCWIAAVEGTQLSLYPHKSTTQWQNTLLHDSCIGSTCKVWQLSHAERHTLTERTRNRSRIQACSFSDSTNKHK